MIYSATLNGVEPVLVEIEIDLSPGLPFFQIVGLPDEILRESKTRVKSSIQQAGFKFPYESRIVLNLAPSKLKKEGSAFELALASKILATHGQILMPDKSGILVLGELALDGSIRSTDGIMALALAAETNPKIEMVVMPEDAVETMPYRLSKPLVIMNHLRDLQCPNWWEKTVDLTKVKETESLTNCEDKIRGVDLNICEVSEFWATHLKIASIGEHHYLLSGSPGCGKTFFAEAVRDLREGFCEISGIEMKILNSVFERKQGELPWSSPHHSATLAGLVGGGSPPQPGAVTRAHRGILFLDELLEFSPSVLDALREPLEKGYVDIARAKHCLRFPSKFQLIAATNPCRCGYWGHPEKFCACALASRLKYQQKLSGPLRDRFDVILHCPAPLGSEKKVRGAEIKNFCKEVMLFKNQSSHKGPELTRDAQDFIEFHLGGRIKNHRQKAKIKSLGWTLALLDFSRKVTEKNLEEALKLQSGDLEPPSEHHTTKNGNHSQYRTH